MPTEYELAPEDVRAARALIQWSQTELADAAGVGVSTIADFEKGSRTPIANNLAAIRGAFENAGVQFTPTGPTIFSEVSLHIMTQASAMEMRFRYKSEGAAAVQEIIAAFGSVEGDRVELNPVQTASATLKAGIDVLLQRHGSAVPQLNQLKKVIGSLSDGEHFLLLPARPDKTAGKLALERYLHGLNHPEDHAADSGVDDLFGLLLERYDTSSLRTDRYTLIGADRDSRTCRFCNRTKATGATFKKVAHVIPTALGNDHLKSAEECDDCNGYFGRETEPSLIAILDVQRVFLGTQGRDGRPKLHFGEGTLAHDGDKVIIESKSITRDAFGTLVVDLGKGAAFTPSAAYRALVKMIISVIGDEQLPHLKETIEWVRHGMHSDRPLPKVASSVIDLPPNPSAQITVYTRRHPHPRLPHIVGEFRLGCYVYVFAVPFSDQDQWDLVGFFDDADFKDTFKHYVPAQWVQQDLSGQMKVVTSPQLKFAQRPA